MLYADKRTIAGLAANASTSFLHGLSKVPDGVNIRFIAQQASSTNVPQITAPVDVTAVTLQNCGSATSPNMEVVTYVLHALVV